MSTTSKFMTTIVRKAGALNEAIGKSNLEMKRMEDEETQVDGKTLIYLWLSLFP
jgi:hypothetical protein